ncbi:MULTISPECIES: DUF4235 domain-containing protein [Arthrobacter]|uniref:DUF4235 domain-containing protein n=1 Tax=Arthrobacter psychrochitiniphilus TaxID=291045 RepID=A0A2V3DTZ6_9MICC|nr:MULTISPECIES: DUF4235 domain-containing protein [Arthrobacter]NYG15609.1 hypothetical protein [Arthrobacter psychrochitiniphilus]PXA66905.1 hypothetical protein CVS29_04950 [Arthrobacter psychrochitiniphilus]
MNIVFKLLGTGISLGAGFVASKLVDSVWEKSTGNKPPKDGADLNNSLRSALTFALVSSVVAAIIQTLASRTTQKAIARFNKHPEEI